MNYADTVFTNSSGRKRREIIYSFQILLPLLGP